MAKIRTIKPEFWEDEKLSTVSLQSRLLFIGCWNFADDFGVLPSSVKWLRIKLFPYDSLRDNDVQQWVDSLVKNRMLVPFAYSEKGYYVIRRFRSHQIIDTRYEKSTVPKDVIQEFLIKIENETTQLPQCDHNVLTPMEGEGKGSGKDGEGGPAVAAKQPPKKIIPHLFTESDFFEKTRLAAALTGTQYDAANVDYYHEQALNWSESKNEKKSNWLATLKNWMARDMTEGKFITKNFKPPVNGIKSGIKPTGGEVSNFDLATTIAKHYSKPGG